MFEDRLPYDDNYGLLDPALGDSVIVDGFDLYNYNADLINYEPVIATISSDIYKKIGRHSYLLNRFGNGNNGIKLRFYVGGQNAQQAQINCNRVIGTFQKGIVTVIIGDTEFEYSGIMSSYTMKHTDVYNYYLLEITFVAVKRLPFVIYDKTLTFSDNTLYINNDGIIDSGALIVIESKLTKSSVTLTCNSKSITINNFSSYKYHVIDGLNGRVLCGTSTSKSDIINELYGGDGFESYSNNFMNTNLTEFPTIVSGDNNISVSNADGVGDIIVKYYPVFVI